MFFYRRSIPGLSIHSYLVGDEKVKQCIVIDPVRDVEEYIQVAEEQGFEITHIVETHVHADFVSGSKELKASLNGNPIIHCSGMGGEKWIPVYADHAVQDGEEITLGSLSLKAVHTPGHTPEHLMWVLYENGDVEKIFSGDFLFVGAVGRPDLLGDEEVNRLSHQLYHSVFEKLDPYPDQAEVRPAHGAGSFCGKGLSSNPFSILGIERSHNPSLRDKPEKEWIEALMHEMPPIPKYFPRMKKINVIGADLVKPINREQLFLSPRSVKEQIKKGALILDVRSKETFSAGHIPGSVNISFSPQLSTWAGWVLDDDQSIIFVLDEMDNLKPSIECLQRVGFDQILGYLDGGLQAWKNEGFETSIVKVQTVDDLNLEIQKGVYPYVLDIRTDDEWNGGHIKGAHHIHAGSVLQRMDQLPKDQHISVICRSGFRASIVSSLLMRNGYTNLSNVKGGMAAWKTKGYYFINE